MIVPRKASKRTLILALIAITFTTTTSSAEAQQATPPGLARLAAAEVGLDGSMDGIAVFGGIMPSTAQINGLSSLGLRVQPLERLPMALLRGTRQAMVSAVGQGLAADVYPNDRLHFVSVSSNAAINAQQVHALGIDGHGVGVAVVDSGIDATHPDLAQRVTHNVKIVDADTGLPGASATFFIPVDEGPYNNSDTSSGHGTHVAGIVAADNTDGKMVGVAPGANLIGYGMGDAVFVFSAMIAYDDILKNREAWGIRVINNSFGSSFAMFDPADPINQATKAAHDAGIVVVFAAGNSATEMSIGPNSVAPWVISVGAGTLSHQRADFSSGGLQYDNSKVVALPAADVKHLSFSGDAIGLYHPSVSAPGVNVESTATTGVLVTSPPGGTASASGTSMACPHVAGVVALLLQKKPSLTPDQVKTILQVTSSLMPDTSDSTRSQAFWQSGYGWVDAKAAIDFVSRRFNQNTLNRLQKSLDASVQADRDHRVRSTDYWAWTAAAATVGGTPDSKDLSLTVTSATQAIKALVSYPSLGYVGINEFDYQLTLTDAAGTVVATSTASPEAGVSQLFADLTAGSYAYDQPWNLHVSGELGAQDQDTIMGRLVSVEAAQLEPQTRVPRTLPVFTPTGTVSYYFQPGATGLLTSAEGCSQQSGAPKGGMAPTRNSGLCQSGLMGYAVNYGVGDLAVFISNPIPADITVGGTLSLKIYSVDPAQSAWTAAQSPFIQVEVDALDEAGNYLEPVAAAQFDVCRTVNGTKVCNTGPTPTPGLYSVEIPAIPIPAGSRLRTTIRAAQVVTSTSRMVWGGTGSLGTDFSDAGVIFTTGMLQ